MQEKQHEHWDIVIDANKHKLSLNIKELWRYRDLIMQFAKRDIATVYNQTILGPLWFLIQPLLTSFLCLFVFGGIARIKTDPIPGMLFYLSGLTIWNYLPQVLRQLLVHLCRIQTYLEKYISQDLLRLYQKQSADYSFSWLNSSFF